ncbi:MAG: hypothetical protein BWY83_02746 [bacterium ADurb.Bin478]|nr:MAG: hypothetical protein BWY83_02746 [bacterium ADurb.Bin478]
MNKKAGWLIAALMLVCSTSSFAVGLGLQYSGNAGKIYTNGIAINVKLDDRPMVFAASYYIDDDKSFGLTGDYWLFEKPIGSSGESKINWYAGVGLFLSMFFGDDFELHDGIRVPLGVNMFIDKKIELYAQVVPAFGISMIPTIKTNGFYVPISGGFRVWF